MTVPRGTRPGGPPDNRVIPLYPHPDPWEGQDPLGVSSTERVASHLSDRERAARYAGFDRMALDDGPMVGTGRRRRRRYGCAALAGAVIGTLIGVAAWYAYGAELWTDTVTITAPTVVGKATAVDGDSLRIGSTKIRLFGIDAPESRQSCYQPMNEPWACGVASTAALKHMIERDPQVTCQAKTTDRYGRTVAVCHNAEGDLAARMVAMGWAVDWPKYSGGAYRDHEAAAKAERLGIWSGSFEPPEQWRKGHK